MPPKKRICSDKVPLGKNEEYEKPGVCFNKGVKVGYAAASGRASKIRQGVKKAEPIRIGLAIRKLQKPLAQHNLDTLRATARSVRNNYKQGERETIAGLNRKGIYRVGLITGRGKASA